MRRRSAQLVRLADSLFDTGGELRYELTGGTDAKQRLQLELTVAGTINLTCQRCLGSLAYAIATRTKLLVLTGEAGAETADIDDLDGVPADAHTDVWSLVEDEVLLAIPLAPRHAEDQCSPAVKTAGQQAVSPFAVLAKLAQQRTKN